MLKIIFDGTDRAELAREWLAQEARRRERSHTQELPPDLGGALEADECRPEQQKKRQMGFS